MTGVQVRAAAHPVPGRVGAQRDQHVHRVHAGLDAAARGRRAASATHRAVKPIWLEHAEPGQPAAAGASARSAACPCAISAAHTSRSVSAASGSISQDSDRLRLDEPAPTRAGRWSSCACRKPARSGSCRHGRTSRARVACQSARGRIAPGAHRRRGCAAEWARRSRSRCVQPSRLPVLQHLVGELATGPCPVVPVADGAVQSPGPSRGTARRSR